MEKYGARWISSEKQRHVTTLQSLLKKTVKYLLHICFFQLENKILRQVTGIPVESDSAPFLQIFSFIIMNANE